MRVSEGDNNFSVCVHVLKGELETGTNISISQKIRGKAGEDKKKEKRLNFFDYLSSIRTHQVILAASAFQYSQLYSRVASIRGRLLIKRPTSYVNGKILYKGQTRIFHFASYRL